MSPLTSPNLPVIAPANPAFSSPLTSPLTVILPPSSTVYESSPVADKPSSPSPQYINIWGSAVDANRREPDAELGGELNDEPSRDLSGRHALLRARPLS
jgi:hypothetical protein